MKSFFVEPASAFRAGDRSCVLALRAGACAGALGLILAGCSAGETGSGSGPGAGGGGSDASSTSTASSGAGGAGGVGQGGAGEGGAGGGATGTGGAGSGVGAGGGDGSCGGLLGGQCGPNEWCDFADQDQCGAADQTGQCAQVPPVCNKSCPGACGCDGKFYCNACLAHKAGVDDTPDITCSKTAK